MTLSSYSLQYQKPASEHRKSLNPKKNKGKGINPFLFLTQGFQQLVRAHHHRCSSETIIQPQSSFPFTCLSKRKRHRKHSFPLSQPEVVIESIAADNSHQIKKASVIKLLNISMVTRCRSPLPVIFFQVNMSIKWAIKWQCPFFHSS